MPSQAAWEPLKEGDKVAFLPSSDPIKKEERERFADLLSDWGLRLHSSPVILSEFYCDQGTPKQRADAIIDALKNEDVKALFMRGGNGGEEVIEHLKQYEKEHGLPRRGIPLIGYSDATQFHHYLGSIGAVSAVQGPDPGQLVSNMEYAGRIESFEKRLAEKGVSDGEKEWIGKNIVQAGIEKSSTESVRKFLMEGVTQEAPLVCVNDAAKKVGAVVGAVEGKMVVFNEHSRRSDYRIVADESYRPIMLLEGGFKGKKVREGVEFAIRYLRETGQLDNLQAIVLSQSDGKCFSGQKLEESDLSEAVEAIKGLNIPVFFGAPFGHGPISSFDPLPLGTETRIQSSSDGKLTLSFDSIRTKEDVEQVEALCSARPSYASQLQQAGSVGEGQTGSDKIFQPIKATLVSGEDRSKAGRSRDYVACRTKSFQRGYDVPALERENLSGKDIMIYLDYDDLGFPSFENWARGTDNKEQRALYQKTLFGATKQVMQMPLNELVKMGKLQDAGSLTLVARQDFLDEAEEWIGAFAKDHDLKTPIRFARCDTFPKDKLSKDRPTLIGADVSVMNPHETEMDKLDRKLKIGHYR